MGISNSLPSFVLNYSNIVSKEFCFETVTFIINNPASIMPGVCTQLISLRIVKLEMNVFVLFNYRWRPSVITL